MTPFAAGLLVIAAAFLGVAANEYRKRRAAAVDRVLAAMAANLPRAFTHMGDNLKPAKVTTKRPGWRHPAVRWHRGQIVQISAQTDRSKILHPEDRAELKAAMAHHFAQPVDIDWHHRRDKTEWLNGAFTVHLIGIPELPPDPVEAAANRLFHLGTSCGTLPLPSPRSNLELGRRQIERTHLPADIPDFPMSTPMSNPVETPVSAHHEKPVSALRPRLSDETIQRIGEMDDEGSSERAIAAALGVSAGVVNKYKRLHRAERDRPALHAVRGDGH